MQYNFLNPKRTFPKRGFRECSFFCFQIENRKTKKIIEMANRIFHFVIYFLEKVWYDSIWFIRLHESTISCWITNHAAFHEIGSADSRICCISDNADDEGAMSFDQFEKIAAKRVADLVLAIAAVL